MSHSAASEPSLSGVRDGGKTDQRLRAAAKSFERERYPEALRVLRPLAQGWPESAAIRELLGITYYRLGRWRKAIDELEAFRTLTGSTEQHPVLADCYRALGCHGEVDELWEELRAASPGGELMAEGRIVTAGSLAERGRVAEALALLEKGFKLPAQPKAHQLRRAYALADLRERAGDLPGARSLFDRLTALAPDFADAPERARSLR